MKYFIFALLIIVTLCRSALARQQGAPKWHQLTADYSFEQYMQDFHKPYTTGSVEWFERKGLFEASLKRILAHNADASQSYKKGVNQFTDLTEDERRVRTSMFPKLHSELARDDTVMLTEKEFTKVLRREATPQSNAERQFVDYRLNVPPVLTTVKDQGHCGSCWSFGTTEAIETHFALQFGKLHVLSEQQLVSCVPPINATFPGFNDTMHGCHGSLSSVAIDFLVSQGGGMTTEWMDPYSSYFYWTTHEPIAKCNRKPALSGSFVNVTGYKLLKTNDLQNFKETLENVGPITITMYVTKSFWDYESGVFADKGCIANPNMMPSHVVLLVGYGHDAELKKDYWIVRNSWNSDWGEDGYFRLLREETQEAVNASCGRMPLPEPHDITKWVNSAACGTCGILSSGIYPTVTQN